MSAPAPIVSSCGLARVTSIFRVCVCMLFADLGVRGWRKHMVCGSSSLDSGIRFCLNRIL